MGCRLWGHTELDTLKRLSSSSSRTYSGPVLASSPRMPARKLPRRMSRAAESQSVLMFLALKNGIYGKKDAYKSVYAKPMCKNKQEVSVEMEDLGSAVCNV